MARAAWLAACLLLAASCSPLAAVAQRPPAVPACPGGDVLPGVAAEYVGSFGGVLFPGLPAYVLSIGCSNYAQDWNSATQWTIREAGTYDSSPRIFALLHLAQWQALKLNNASGSPVNGNFLVAFVSHNILLSVQPQFVNRFDALLARQIAGFDYNALRLASAAANAVAAALLAARAGDGSASASLYVPAPPGGPAGVFEAIVWPGLPPGLTLAQFANASGFIVPKNHTQAGIATPQPLATGSAAANAQLKATKLQGGNVSDVRTPYQTETAFWWSEGNGTSGCCGTFNQLALITMRPNATLQQSVQLLAQINVAAYDSFLVIFREKYRWLRWRAVTAIRRGSCAPSNETVGCLPPDPNWTPLLTTPNYPSWPGWRGACGGPAELILTREHGANFSFTLGTEAVMQGRLLPGRVFNSFEHACLDAVNARIWGGFGTPQGSLAGRNVTHAVTRYVLARFDKLDPTSPKVAPVYAGMAAAFKAALASPGGT